MAPMKAPLEQSKVINSFSIGEAVWSSMSIPRINPDETIRAYVLDRIISILIRHLDVRRVGQAHKIFGFIKATHVESCCVA